jgi:cation transport regulator ChaB
MGQEVPKKAQADLERDLREMNEALIISSLRQQELTDEAEHQRLRAETATAAAEAALKHSERAREDLILSEEQ